jgi:6-phosphogluconolactonase/glucosamine-6-phosphate isomerase/deaminase
MVGELIGDHADIPAEQFHTIRAESETAAVDYDRQLRETLAWREKGQDRLDYALLTMDAEGGTAGMRPGDRAGGDESALVRAYRRPDDPAPDRVALALPFLNATRFIAVLVTGAPLAGAVRRLAGDGCAAGDMPIAGLAPINGELTWYLDGPACGDGTG